MYIYTYIYDKERELTGYLKETQEPTEKAPNSQSWNKQDNQ
jgi:hypothetical protein